MPKEIIVTKRTSDYHACLKGHPELWGCGKHSKEAIEDLISAHQNVFGETNIIVSDDTLENFLNCECADCATIPCPIYDSLVTTMGYSGECSTIRDNLMKNRKCLVKTFREGLT